jgi:cytochrome c-type biogenesis protein CcmH/NrfF
MRDEIAMLAREGKTKQQILNYYVEKYGSQEPLAEPIDEGFNRLAWMLPYVLGAAGLVTIVLTARHWTRARMAAAGAEDQTIDPALDARLDDELRNLD